MFYIRKENSISITKLSELKKKNQQEKSKHIDRPGRKWEHTALLAITQLQLQNQLL